MSLNTSDQSVEAGISLARWIDLEDFTIVPDDRLDYGEPRYRAYGFIHGAAYCLIFLLLWAQVDDAWVSAPVSLSASLDDDEYLPVEGQREGEESVHRHRPVFAVPNVHPGTFFAAGFANEPSGALFAAPFYRSSVYVFMSLRR